MNCLILSTSEIISVLNDICTYFDSNCLNFCTKSNIIVNYGYEYISIRHKLANCYTLLIFTGLSVESIYFRTIKSGEVCVVSIKDIMKITSEETFFQQSTVQDFCWLTLDMVLLINEIILLSKDIKV